MGLWMRTPQPRTGAMRRTDVSATILRVPTSGGRTIQKMRRKPAASPGMAAIQ